MGILRGCKNLKHKSSQLLFPAPSEPYRHGTSRRYRHREHRPGRGVAHVQPTLPDLQGAEVGPEALLSAPPLSPMRTARRPHRSQVQLKTPRRGVPTTNRKVERRTTASRPF